MDSCGVWISVLRLSIGCTDRCVQTFKYLRPTESRSFLKFLAGQQTVKENSLPRNYSVSKPYIKTLDFLKSKPIKQFWGQNSKSLNSKSSSTRNHHCVTKIRIVSLIPHPSMPNNISYGLNKSLSNCGKQRDNTVDNRINFDSIMRDITHGKGLTSKHSLC